MCYNCYREYGEPTIVNEKTLAVAEMINNIYNHSCVGGYAHVVVDDWNLENHNILSCLRELINKESDSANIERKALLALLEMSEDERASAMAIHEGWLS